MQFDWSPVSHDDWRALLAEAPRANLLQSWPYAVAARLHDQMMSRRALIREGAEAVGMMQLQEIEFGPVHVVKLERGPLWLDGEEGPKRWRNFLHAFNREFPRRLGRWRRLLPELEDGDETRALLREAGLRQKGPEPYRTIVLDLGPPLDEIRGGLKQKWRNALRQAERAGLSVETDLSGASATDFLAGYDADKSSRAYRGPAPARLATLIASSAPLGDALIFTAANQGKTIASILMFRHGNAATYQAGWTGPDGRAARAHHLLLWSAIARLKEDGATALDLGGIHPKMAEGVTRFKEGLGGTPLTLAGLFG
jgi:hypothetical protein